MLLLLIAHEIGGFEKSGSQFLLHCRIHSHVLHRTHHATHPLIALGFANGEGRVAAAVLKAYLHGVLPVLARLVASSKETATLYRYYWDTIEACVPPGRIMATMAAAGFAGVARHVSLGVFSEYRASAV